MRYRRYITIRYKRYIYPAIGREKTEEERKAREQRDNLLKLRSRFVAEKANNLISKGDSYTARKILLDVLPSDSEKDIPITAEAEIALREADKHETAIIHGHTDFVNSASFSKDGKIIISSSYDKSIRLWDVFTGGQIDSIISPNDTISYACFSPNDKIILYVVADHSIGFLDAKTKDQIGKLIIPTSERTIEVPIENEKPFLSGDFLDLEPFTPWECPDNIEIKYEKHANSGINVPLVADCNVPPVAQCNVPPQKWLQ